MVTIPKGKGLSKKIIAPSILSADFANLEKEIQAVTSAGADWIHVDVMDGHFVPNLTIGIPVVSALKKVSKIPLDVHLMIDHPEKYVEDFLKAGSDVLTLHVESTDELSLKKSFELIRKYNKKIGLSLRPKTSLAEIKKYLHEIDLVLVMTVEPGFGGQSFMEDQVPKINELYQIRELNNLSFLIEVDGGVSDKTLGFLNQADALVAGNYVFKNDYAQAISFLKG